MPTHGLKQPKQAYQGVSFSCVIALAMVMTMTLDRTKSIAIICGFHPLGKPSVFRHYLYYYSHGAYMLNTFVLVFKAPILVEKQEAFCTDLFKLK